MIKSEFFRADKIKYKDSINCCIWIPFEEDETMGIAFDFPEDYTDDLIALLTRLKQEPAEEHEAKQDTLVDIPDILLDMESHFEV